MIGTAFPDRVKGLAWFDVARFEEAALNFRTHDGRQSEVLRGLLSEIGIADGLLVWIPEDSARAALRALPPRDLSAFARWVKGYRGPVRLIDGHARKAEIRQDTPAVVTDLDSVEADKLLAVFDAVSDLAGADAGTLAKLLQGVHGSAPGTLDLLSELQAFADTSLAKAEPIKRAPEPGASKAVEVSDLEVSFFLSARGPVAQQPEAIERLREALKALSGVQVEVGIIGGSAGRG